MNNDNSNTDINDTNNKYYQYYHYYHQYYYHYYYYHYYDYYYHHHHRHYYRLRVSHPAKKQFLSLGAAPHVSCFSAYLTNVNICTSFIIEEMWFELEQTDY